MSRGQFLKLCFSVMAGLSLPGLFGCAGRQVDNEGGHGNEGEDENGKGKKDKKGGNVGGGGGY